MKQESLTILGIETSCDDTGIAILKIPNPKSNDQRPKTKGQKLVLLSNIVSSQIKIHKKYGGVYPTLAKREHQRNLVPVLAEALKKAKMLKKAEAQNLNGKSNLKLKVQNLKNFLEREKYLQKKLISFLKKYKKPDIDLIAVTNGPGLEPCLWVGVNFAKSLSYFWDIPIVTVNHIEAHILINFLPKINEIFNFSAKAGSVSAKQFPIFKNFFPAVCLVVSGGHTQLILMHSIGKYKILGETRDDAAGECFDKCAKMLGLGYPGGPAIAAAAAKLKIPNPKFQIPKLPRPMIYTKDYDFSFSGLKTAVLYANQKPKTKNQKYKQEMAKEIQQAIIDVLIKKTIKAVKDFEAKTIILGGGVVANKELRKQFAERIKKEISNTQLLIPNTHLSTDNALMVAITGYFRRNKKIPYGKLQANANLRIS